MLVVLAFVLMLAYLIIGHAYPGASIIGCPFRALTSLSCPGCGMTRSTAHFIHGDLWAAFEFHPFGPFFIVGFGVAALHHGVRLWKRRKLDYAALRMWRRIQKPVWVAAAVFVGLFGGVRLVAELTGFLTPI